MPLHRTGLVSRYTLTHPEDETTPEKLPYEHVLKYNPNHGPDGRFASSGGGGTAGAPTHGAFGQKLPRYTGGGGGSESRMDRRGQHTTLEYRPDRDAGQGAHKTLEYRPDRDTDQGEIQQLKGPAGIHTAMRTPSGALSGPALGTIEQERQKNLEQFGWREADKRNTFLKEHGHGAYYKKYLKG